MVKKLDILLLTIIVALSFMLVYRLVYLSNGSLNLHASQPNVNYANQGPSHVSAYASSQQISANISANEVVNPQYISKTNALYNFLFNEKFLPGSVNVSDTGSVTGCYANNYLTFPHFVWTCIPAPIPIFGCIPIVQYDGSTTHSNTTYKSLVGYLGFPQYDSGTSTNCPARYANLFSAVSSLTDLSTLTYCLPTQSKTITENGYQYTNDYTPYPNFINWSIKKTVHSYTGTSNGQSYYYAINNSFDPSSSSPSLPAGSTLIIPALSCGATFLNNYLSYLSASSAPGIPAIISLSGFTPSVGLASGSVPGNQVIYLFGISLWPGIRSSLLAHNIQALSSSFSYSLPKALNYAKFPNGNKGDTQYLNVSTFFSTPLNTSYFFSGTSSNIVIYASNTSISSINTTAFYDLSKSAGVTCGFCRGRYGGYYGGYAPSQTQTIQFSKLLSEATQGSIPANTYTLPNLQGAYYPGLTTYPESSFYTYDLFKSDGVFPFCKWNPSTNNVLQNCTFEDSSSINPISYYRLWQSNYLNSLNVQPFSPMQDIGSQLNNFTIGAMDSFCFYGENFNTATGVYTAPSFTRIIPPTAEENYTAAIGACNAFFNNTNCFSQNYNSYMNFNDGIFMSGISCTPTGINASKVEDAWIRSIYIANNGGSFCGDFLGQKNITYPTANSTVFLQNLSTGCPAFDSNNSEASLVVTVKNVGNANITNPYLVVLFGNNNISDAFYSSRGSQISDYNLYHTFIQQMESQTNGLIDVRYNNTLATDMYVFSPGNILNPVPIQTLFPSSSYLSGPFNNSLLGMWMYAPSLSQGTPNTQVIRTSNSFLVHSDSGKYGAPIIAPGGNATFTIQVPISVFETLLSKKYNISVYFGNMFNVSWNSPSSTPQLTIGSGVAVNPLVSSGNTNKSQTHNNEFIDPSSTNPSPLSQYMVSYVFNLRKKPFAGISVYSNSLNISIGNQATQNALQIGVNPSVNITNGSGSFALNLKDLVGSSVSCFASQENIQDFSVFWSTQAVSPYNLKYAAGSFYKSNSNVNNILVNRWRGLLFMPYTDSVALNYNNMPIYPISTVSMGIQSPSINKTTYTLPTREAFVYFGPGGEARLTSGLSDTYNSLSVQPSLSIATIPSSAYGASIFTGNIRADKSVIKIVGTRTLVNASTFAHEKVTLSLLKDGTPVCGNTAMTTNGSGAISVASSSCISASSSLNDNLIVSSQYGPFYVEVYNSSAINMSNPVSNGVYFIASNLSSDSKVNSVYTANINLSSYAKNGLTLVFGLPPHTTILTNSKLYLYYANDTPFNCNIVDTLNTQPNNLSSASEISQGYYNTPNGTIFCRVQKPFTGVRAVFTNASNNKYLISGDVGLGITIQNLSGKSLMVTDSGVPLNSQNVTIYSFDSAGNPTSCLVDKVVTNGILNYSGCVLKTRGNYTLSFTEINNGQTVIKTAALLNVTRTLPGDFLLIAPVVVSDTPSIAYNLTFSSESAGPMPLLFSLPEQGSCNGIRVLGNSPYPMAELPYQVNSILSGTCTYSIIANKSEAYNGNSYMIFAGENPSPITYSSNWANVSATPYSVAFSTDSYNATLLGNCKASSGPCLSGFHLSNGANIGDLLVNNVSASQASVSEVYSGPISDCFLVSYSASQRVVWKESNFSGINYNANNLYQVTNPSQTVSSTYCFFKNSNVITDTISSTGSAVAFSVTDELISNFSYVKTSSGQSFYVPPPKFVGFGSFSKVYVGKQQVGLSNYTGVNLNMSCMPNIYANVNVINSSGTTLPYSTYNASGNYNKVYCVFGGRPTYTSQAGAVNNSYATKGGETVNLTYRPGIYNISTASSNGKAINATLYADCSLTKNVTTTSRVQQLSNGEKLYILKWPRLYVNGTWVDYNPTNIGERYLANYTAIINDQFASPGGIVYSLSGISLINSCPANYTIQDMTYCSKPVPTVPSSGSYSNIEALPLGGEIGGGCYLGSLGSTTFSCMPTDGTIAFAITSPISSASTTGTTTYTIPKVYENSTSPINGIDALFNCNGWVYAANSSSGVKSYKNTTISCSNGNAGTDCSSSVVLTSIAQSINESKIVTECSISYSSSSYPYIISQSMNLTMNSISASQSNPTGPLANNTCGNFTNLIGANLNAGIATSWTHFTKGIYNPIISKTTFLPEVGGCEIGRDSINITPPTASQTVKGSSYSETYSCPSGYSGTIESCVSAPATLFAANINTDPSCYMANYTEVTSYTSYSQENGNSSNGAVPTSCKPFSGKGYAQPTVSNGCTADHFGITNETSSSYALQYSNSSSAVGFGIGIGVINSTFPTNISIPQGGSHTQIKDQYMSGLSVSQNEFTNIITHLLPTNILLSSLGSSAIKKSSIFPFDTLNILMLQNPYFGVSGVPGFVNGSVYDYALSLFTGGTSANCIPGLPSDNLFSLGEGELCSGQNLPPAYSSGIYLPLGALSQGLHSVQFYSISETGNTSAPSVNILGTTGSATGLNTVCTNGNSRVFTSTYHGGNGWSVNLTSDEECNSINNVLYGYVVNCLYQTPGNLTYTTSSRYYLAYNLPTLWNVSYTLLVSPKTYNIIPIPVYQVDSKFGTYLSIYHFKTTTFAENGLPQGKAWTMTYDNVTKTSASNSISFLTPGGKHGFSLPTLVNSSASQTCTSTYTPNPASGNLTAGTTKQIVFGAKTNCTTVFNETGLPPGDVWKVVYSGTTYSARSPNNISISSDAGSYYFSVPNVNSPHSFYSASPSFGQTNAGATVKVKFALTQNVTTSFLENGLPKNTKWSLTYNTTTNNSYPPQLDIVNINLFPSSYGKTYNFNVPSLKIKGAPCGNWREGGHYVWTYSPSPSSGNAVSGSSNNPISFSSSKICTIDSITTFQESGLPSSSSSSGSFSWSVTFDGAVGSSSTSSLQIDSSALQDSSYPFKAYNGVYSNCSTSGVYYEYYYTPDPSSGNAVAGSGNTNIKYTYSSIKRTNVKCSS